MPALIATGYQMPEGRSKSQLSNTSKMQTNLTCGIVNYYNGKKGCRGRYIQRDAISIWGTVVVKNSIHDDLMKHITEKLHIEANVLSKVKKLVLWHTRTHSWKSVINNLICSLLYFAVRNSNTSTGIVFSTHKIHKQILHNSRLVGFLRF